MDNSGWLKIIDFLKDERVQWGVLLACIVLLVIYHLGDPLGLAPWVRLIWIAVIVAACALTVRILEWLAYWWANR
jgi:hypothetical protein